MTASDNRPVGAVGAVDEPQLVVAAAVVDDLDRPRRVLAARRIGPSELSGRWELPGGKVEPGEDPVVALRREIDEELGVSLVVGPELVPPKLVPQAGRAWPLSDVLRMRVWLAQIADGEITTSTDHDQLWWVSADDIAELNWLPGDRPVVEVLRRLLLSHA